MKSKRLFAEQVMPALRQVNCDPEPQVETRTATYEPQHERPVGPLPLYGDFNYSLVREAPETVGEFVERDNGSLTCGWEMRVPEREPDGFPYEIIFVGPTASYRGSAIRLHLVTGAGEPVSDDAEVVLETCDPERPGSPDRFCGQLRPVQPPPGSARAERRAGRPAAGGGR